MKKPAKILVYSLLSIILVFAIAEFIYRSLLFGNSDNFNSLRNPSYYSGYATLNGEDYFNTDYWKLHNIFNDNLKLENPDSLLGWLGDFNQTTYKHFDQNKLENKRPVLLFGDAFSACADSESCFQDILNADPQFSNYHHLLNYGTKGYGVDQTHLLQEQVVKMHYKPLVVLGMNTVNLDKSLLRYSDAQKPYFTLSNGDLQLNGTPITTSESKFIDQNPPQIGSYLWSRFKNVTLSSTAQREKAAKESIKKSRLLNRAILLKTFQQLKASNVDFVVLIFHPNHLAMDNWRLDFLKDLFKTHKIPYLCNRDILDKDNKKNKTADQSKYVINGGSYPTSYANKLVSDAIKDHVLKGAKRKEITTSFFKWKEEEREHQIKTIQEKILVTKEWLAVVEKQAKERGISLDSNLFLNARYVVNQRLPKKEKEIQKLITRIKNDPVWLKKVTDQAKERELSVDQMLYLNANYMINQRNK